MRYEVLLTPDAEHDLEAIHDFIAESDSSVAAERVLDRLTATVETLATLPERGSHPRELLALGFREYRQVIFRPWRVIYRVIGQRVFIYVIADGRRDMQSLLAQSLLDA
jgi:toxin ParE1/3/4